MTTKRHTLFLPMTRREMDARGWRELDVLLITGDAYFDHPSHGAAVIGRTLEAAGYRVGIIARPDWRFVEPFKVLGRPRLFVGVTAGAVDSIVNNYTAHMAKRKEDVYAPGGIGGGRPDMATLVYANRVREAFPKIPVILGGIEASLRRFAYFDTLRQNVRRSLLVDARADLLVFGPGESQAVAVAHRLSEGRSLAGIPGTAYLLQGHGAAPPEGSVPLPDFRDIEADPFALVRQTTALEIGARPGSAAGFHQWYAEGVVIAAPRAEETVDTLDRTAALPFVREVHPLHEGKVPAFETVRWSIISHRGCPGGCSFCGLAVHQGREVISRSDDSILEEARILSQTAGFRGTITDVGGPTANAFGLERTDSGGCDTCRRVSCLHPKICRRLAPDSRRLLALLERIKALPAVKHLFLASGIRHDLALETPDLIDALAEHYTGGHLKAAPEHVDQSVLKLMRKPSIALFEEFEAGFLSASRRCRKEQYVVPYFIAGFVGSGPEASRALEAWLAKRGQRLQQAQTFIPLAGTAAAAMYAARRDDRGDEIYVPDLKERRRQKQAVTRTPTRRSKASPRKR